MNEHGQLPHVWGSILELICEYSDNVPHHSVTLPLQHLQPPRPVVSVASQQAAAQLLWNMFPNSTLNAAKFKVSTYILVNLTLYKRYLSPWLKCTICQCTWCFAWPSSHFFGSIQPTLSMVFWKLLFSSFLKLHIGSQQSMHVAPSLVSWQRVPR